MASMMNSGNLAVQQASEQSKEILDQPILSAIPFLGNFDREQI
jgi:hypothetical protein